ncbi:hypothetical protein Csa_002676, partial [Cucumis sativus]
KPPFAKVPFPKSRPISYFLKRTFLTWAAPPAMSDFCSTKGKNRVWKKELEHWYNKIGSECMSEESGRDRGIG